MESAPQVKVCRHCRVEKVITEFRVDRIYIKNECRVCERKAASQYKKDNPEACATSSRNYYARNQEVCKTKKRKWRKDNPEKYLAQRRKWMYGITPEEYNKMFALQKGCCAICDKKTKLCIDHCHKTNKIRGLLCKPCNSYLGMISDSVVPLQKAIQYLQKSSS